MCGLHSSQATQCKTCTGRLGPEVRRRDAVEEGLQYRVAEGGGTASANASGMNGPEVEISSYELMKEADPELLDCPEVFAMAVLVSTYRNLPPGPRRKFLAHFDSPSPPESKMQERQCKQRHLRRSMGASHRSMVLG